MTGEVYDLKVDRHQTPLVLVADADGKKHQVPLTAPPGEGWTMWAVEEEDGTVIGHYIRRRGVKRGE